MSNSTLLFLTFGAVLVILLIGAGIYFLSRPRPAAETKPAEGLAEAGRILYDPQDGKVLLESRGEIVTSRAALPPEVDTALTNFYQELSRWYGQPAQAEAPAAPMPPPLVDNPAPAAPPPATPAPVPAPPPTVLAPAPVVKPAAIAPSAPEIKRTGLLTSFMHILQSDVKSPDKLKSIAEQVDEILQEQLATTPLRDRGIRLADDPSGGLLIWVGLEKYEGVEQVNDPAIVEAIKAAVAEWRQRTVN